MAESFVVDEILPLKSCSHEKAIPTLFRHHFPHFKMYMNLPLPTIINSPPHTNSLLPANQDSHSQQQHK